MAPVGGTRKVIGSRMATPFTEPSPGIAPMNSPNVTPAMISARLSGSKAIAKPFINRLSVSIPGQFSGAGRG